MGSIALLARELGHDVTGSDENVYPPMSDLLAGAGITVSEGYRAEGIPADTELVVIGNANLPRGNPAVEAVLDRGIEYTSGAEWLGRYLLRDRWVIAISGTHGKTTTTSMVAWILEYAGMSPGFLVGGVPGNFKESARLGDTPFFVIEADEYDTSYFDRRSKFLHYHPRTLVIGNLEYDHADIFENLAQIQYQFHLLLRTVPGSGLVIHPLADPNVNAVLDKGCWTPRFTVDRDDPAADLRAELEREDASRFTVVLGETRAPVDWQLGGLHNVSNALAAIAAARHVGVTIDVAAAALSQFKGVKRRMEKIFESPSVSVYDDFAHHPTAIATTLEGLRRHVGNEPILAIIEPASHTMRKGTHAATLARSAACADRVIWFRPQRVSWDMGALVESGRSEVQDDIDATLDVIMGNIERGARHVVIMSNGGFGGIHRKLLERLGHRIAGD